jgi:hypothetical protein
MLGPLKLSDFPPTMAPKKPASKASPKGKSTAAKTKAQKRKAEVEDIPLAQSTSSASIDKAFCQNMIGQLKNAKARIENGKPADGDEEKVQMLEKYQSLGRFSEEKKDILARWTADKTCSWWRTYEESKGEKYKEDSEGMEGWGSRSVQFRIWNTCLSLELMPWCVLL